MTPAERFAQRTWSMLGLAKQLRARFGEETLTDLLVLDMLPQERASARSADGGDRRALERREPARHRRCNQDACEDHPAAVAGQSAPCRRSRVRGRSRPEPADRGRRPAGPRQAPHR